MVKFPRNFLQFGNAPEMRRQLLDIPPIESLAGFDEFQIMFLKFPFFDWFLSLPVLLATLSYIDDLLEQSMQCQTFRSVCITHAGEQFAKPTVYFEMRIP